MGKPTQVNTLVLPDSIVVNWEHNTFTINDRDENYEKVLACIRENRLQDIPVLMSAAIAIREYVPDGEFVVHRGRVFSHKEEVHGYIARTLKRFAENQLPYKPLLNFWNRLKNNPSTNSVEQLYRFLESAHCPITPTGTFIAYKAVTNSLCSRTSCKETKKAVQYVLGKPETMPRAKVVDDPSDPCGPGLHVGSFAYAKSFASDSGDLILEVEVDPADVVSVPTDSASGKLRACKITPLALCERGEIQEAIVPTPTKPEKSKKKAKKKATASGGPKFGGTRYAFTKLSAAAYAKRASTTTHVKPSKAPKAIRDMYRGSTGVRRDYKGPGAAARFIFIFEDEHYQFAPKKGK